MRDLLHVDPREAAPIWRQIEEGLRRLVSSRALAPGAAVPSVRDLAKDLRVNPATVAKAYQHLAESGVLETRRGEGTFVAEGAPQMKAKDRRLLLKEGATRYVHLALSVGAPRREADEALEGVWMESEVER
jgi:GntR family transcriptional regulator